MGIQTVNTPFPAVNNRLFPSISATTAAPGDVVPESGNGLGYFASPPPGGYRVPGMLQGVGAIVPWPRIQTEWDLIQQERWSNPTLSGLGDCDAETDGDCGVVPTYSAITSNDPEFNGTVQIAVQRIDRILPYDALYNNGGANSPLVYAATIQNYWGEHVARDARVVDAVARLSKRYNYVKTHFPGVTVLPAGSILPGGSTPRAPIIVDYGDGSYAYAPGYGPVSQYGALQVANASVPASPRVSAYTGQTIGTASPGDIQPFSAGTPTDPSTVPPPPSNYQGPLVTGGTTPSGGSSSGAAASDSDSLISGVSNTMLLAGGGALILLLAVMGRR
jgi:hypothetical protein